MKAQYLEKTQDWGIGTTTYWFDVEYQEHDFDESGVITDKFGVVESDDDAVIINESGQQVDSFTFIFVSELINLVTDKGRSE